MLYVQGTRKETNRACRSKKTHPLVHCFAALCYTCAMAFDSILFDLDGTLWDSREAVCASWNAVFRAEGVPLQLTVPYLSAFFGKPMTQIFAELFPDMPAAAREQLRAACCAQENKDLEHGGARVFDGVREGLERLRREFELFIVSNCQSGYIETFLRAFSLEALFSGHVSWGDTGLSKGKNNLLIIEQYALKCPVYVGDAAVDEQAAAEAGIAFIFARYGFGSVSSYDGAIDSFAELAAALPAAELRFLCRRGY